MKRFSKTIIVFLSLALIVAYFVPIWEIDLEAPQYPEGLGMKIWINRLAGDINTINGLNHYIGMQKIDESSIPELRYMPYLLGAIIGLGLLTAVIGKKWMLYIWVILFSILGVAGAVDFYLWEYDYGHNLDPTAAIKIPGMSYQPPLLGSKQLLNFTAHSYPDVGGFIIIIAGLTAVLLLVYNSLPDSKSGSCKIPGTFSNKAFGSMLVLFFAIAFVFSSCNSGPEPIVYGKDICTHCKMKIVDERFGAELVTKYGKIYKFDALECMVNFTNELDDQARQKVELYLVANASQKGELIHVSQAVYLQSENFPSPMGANISAYADEIQRNEFENEYAGTPLSWEEAKVLIMNMNGHILNLN